MGERSRPGLKSAQAVPGLGCGAREIDQPVFLRENRRERGLRVVLRTRRDACRSSVRPGWRSSARPPSAPAAAPGSAQYLPARCASSRCSRMSPVSRPASMRMVVTPVICSPDGDRPLDRRGATIFRQQRGMQVDVAQRRQIDHPLRNDASVADDDDRLRRDAFQLRAKFLVVLDLLRLGDRKIELRARRASPATPPVPCRGRWDDRAGSPPASRGSRRDTSFSSVGTANCGVPQKTRSIMAALPFALLHQLADLALHQVALQRADVADVELAVEVVGFVQQRARQQFFAARPRWFRPSGSARAP